MARGKKGEVRCSIEGCGKKHFGKGLCSKHYTQMRSHGRIKETIKRAPICTVSGCEKPHKGHGYCVKHLAQMKKYGHIRRTMYDPNTFEFRENICMIGIIKRDTQETVYAIIDAVDFDLVKDRKWFLKKGNSGDYVVSGHRGSYVTLSRLITGAKKGEEVDHEDHDLFNNRRSTNLRVCTKSQNQFNAKIRSDNKSGVKGVHWCKRSKKWIVEINKNKKAHFIGRFKTLEEATTAANEARENLHGQFANSG